MCDTLKGPTLSILVVFFLHHKSKAYDILNSFSLYSNISCMFFSEKFSNAYACFVVSCLLARWCYYSIYLIARPNCALYFLVGIENVFLHKKVSVNKIYSMISMNRTHLFTQAHDEKRNST